jgi:hypothetical protein
VRSRHARLRVTRACACTHTTAPSLRTLAAPSLRMLDARLRPHALSLAVFGAQLCGYVALSSVLQRRWYHAQGSSRRSSSRSGGGGGGGGGNGGAGVRWRCQPDSTPHAPDGLGAQARVFVLCPCLACGARRARRGADAAVRCFLRRFRRSVRGSGCGRCRRWRMRAAPPRTTRRSSRSGSRCTRCTRATPR